MRRARQDMECRVSKGPVLIAWQRFGPYHHARADAARRVMPLATLEMSPVDRTYAWDRVIQARPDHFTATEQSLDALSAGQLRRLLRATLDRISPSVVAVPGWSERWALIILEWSLDRHVPAVLMSDSNAFDENRTASREWIKRRIVSRFSAGLAGGTMAADYLVQLGMDRKAVFSGYDVVDNSHFQTATPARMDAARTVALGRPFFLASARFIPKKNLAGLLKAYAAYRQRAGSDAWALIVLGDGPLRPKLERLRTELSLSDDVVFPGFKQYGELPAWYAAAEAFILPSTAEQWGLVVNEAMAAGLPVLVSRRCGCAVDLVEEGKNGFVVDPFQIEDMTHAMWRIAHGGVDRKALGAGSREIIRNWSPGRFADGLRQATAAAAQTPEKNCSLFHRALFRALVHR
jgi:glycosyltransferase involved in cell wall biosynthesis